MDVWKVLIKALQRGVFNVGDQVTQSAQEVADDKLAGDLDKQAKLAQKKLPVMEVFGPTIQGEGLLAGTQTHFVRFGLCDYACTMCDSIHAVDANFVSAHAKWMTQQEIDILLTNDFPHYTPWVTLSGGNPAIHNLDDLVSRLHYRGIKISIETQGTFAPDWIDRLDVITVSPKSPGMGEKFEQHKFGRFLAKYAQRPGLNIKVVIFAQQDLEFAAMINESFVLPFGFRDKFYLSLGNAEVPVIEDGELLIGTNRSDEHKLGLLEQYAQLADEITADHRLANARFQPQLHVLAWSNQPGR